MFKHTLPILITILLLSTNISPFASAQVTAERILPAQGYLPEQTLIVEIKIQGEPGEFTIKETPPMGWQVWRISHKGKFENGLTQWSLMLTNNPLTLTYWITVPVDAVGNYEFMGILNDQPVTGDTRLEPHIPEPVGIFSDHCDFLGKGETLGDAHYDPVTGDYEIIGGDHIDFDWVYWGFHMSYREISGNVTMQAKIHPIQLDPTNLWAGVSMGFFDSIAQGSKCFYERVYAENNPRVEYTWRDPVHTSMNADIRSVPYTDAHYEIKVVRENNQCMAYYRHIQNEEWILHITKQMVFEDPIIVFIFARAVDNTNILCKGIFSELEITEESSVQDWALYP